MANEIVKYHNDLNTVVMRKWTAEEMNFFFAIISDIRDKGTEKLTFGKTQLIEMTRYKLEHNRRFYDTIENLADNITKLRYVEKTSNSLSYMSLFECFDLSWSDDLSEMEVVVQVSGKFEYIVNRLLDTQVDENGNPVKTKGFTMYELAEFTQIKSTYAKTMYRLLKQWRTIGRRELKIEEFKTLLDAPKTYKSSHIDRLIIKPIMKELPAFFKDLKFKKVKAKTKGNPVKSYIFTWTPEGKRKQAEVVNGDSLPAPVVPVEVPVFDSLEAFFGAIEGISVDNQKAITEISSNFEPAEVLGMLSFAESLRKQKAKSAIAYTIKVIKEWAENDIKTLEEAKKFHEVNYSQKGQKAEPQAKKPKKNGGKKQASGESNVPKWSNPDYKNETSEETKQELERKKQELLAHLEESVNK
ncbi:MAG: RepB family plasmid replication initiator protein [Rothia mucilaginosa]|jgi:plasmid replication initiation protein|nr:RepB family plasmid replication initiator protein [Rothia mucilaginosa]